MSDLLINVRHGVARHPDYRLAEPVDICVRRGEALAICGPNGSGKSLLVDILTGAHPCLGDAVTYDFGGKNNNRASDNIRSVTFRDVYGGYEPAYYQQRWNRADEQVFPTVAEALARQLGLPEGAPLDIDALPSADLMKEIGIEAHLAKQVNLLSSGELRRFQLARMLLSSPEVLIIDNPYIGLDREARGMLTTVLRRLAERLTLVLVVSREEDVPGFITRMINIREGKIVKASPPQPPSPGGEGGVVTLEGGKSPSPSGEEQALPKCSQTSPKELFRQAMRKAELARALPWREKVQEIEEFIEDEHALNHSNQAQTPPTGVTTPPSPPGEGGRGGEAAGGDVVIDFRHITIRYGARTILSDLSWTVHRGEHWALTGENGSGKSTLLSLVCADNPQGYACDIRLFGHRRGRGESIWDIKRHIGYVSPEIFSTYRRALPAIDIVASGLHDTIGLYKRPTPDERTRCIEWFRLFEAESLAERDYLKLSSGEQRLVLLIRAFVKEPDLLILDEPFHGLDNERRLRAQALIDRYMADPSKTLIMVTHYEEELPRCIDHRLTLVKH